MVVNGKSRLQMTTLEVSSQVLLFPEVKMKTPRKVEKRPFYQYSTWVVALKNTRFRDRTDNKGGLLFMMGEIIPFCLIHRIPWLWKYIESTMQVWIVQLGDSFSTLARWMESIQYFSTVRESYGWDRKIFSLSRLCSRIWRQRTQWRGMST